MKNAIHFVVVFDNFVALVAKVDNSDPFVRQDEQIVVSEHLSSNFGLPKVSAFVPLDNLVGFQIDDYNIFSKDKKK